MQIFLVVVSVCPPGWQPNRDRCYNFVFYPKLPYDEAAIECQVSLSGPKVIKLFSYSTWERSGSVVECLTQDRRASQASLRCVLEQEH